MLLQLLRCVVQFDAICIIFAAGGAFVPTQEKKKKKKRPLNPTAFSPLGGQVAHTRKKKRPLEECHF